MSWKELVAKCLCKRGVLSARWSGCTNTHDTSCVRRRVSMILTPACVSKLSRNIWDEGDEKHNHEQKKHQYTYIHTYPCIHNIILHCRNNQRITNATSVQVTAPIQFARRERPRMRHFPGHEQHTHLCVNRIDIHFPCMLCVYTIHFHICAQASQPSVLPPFLRDVRAFLRDSSFADGKGG